MTKTEIIAELRRSAAEDKLPSEALDHDAWWNAIQWKCGEEALGSANPDAQRTYCLLIAHALEDECAAI